MVETAALYFCLDLGLVADIGISKGIDVVDIRARAESQEKANQAVTWLLELKPDNIVVSESVRARLQTDWVLELQCKAADRRVDSTNILYFGYRRQTKGYEQENTISVQQLAHAFTHDPWQGGLLSRFLKLQERVLSLA